ncbi:hypothetical protein HYV83_00550 [Candidatus Woesearchaeota archaeon]|nr:hypothetical protein [Candidatus Woesearchaeota archaeon]
MDEIRVILWDIGGVIQPDDRLPPKILGISPEKYARLVDKEEYQLYFKGLRSIEEMPPFALRYLGSEITPANIRQVKAAILATWEPPRPDVVALIKKIPDRFRKMVLSTVPYDMEIFAREAHEKGLYPPEQQYLQLFRDGDMLFSNRIHATKKEKAAFAAVYDVCRIDPKYWLFIDDRQPNLSVAKEFGVGHVLLYTTTAKLEKELTMLGVLA